MSKRQKFRTYWRGFGRIEVLGHSVALPFGIKAFAFFSDEKLRIANDNYAIDEDGWLVCDVETGAAILHRGEEHYLSVKMVDAIRAAQTKVQRVGRDRYQEGVRQALAIISNDLSKFKESPND